VLELDYKTELVAWLRSKKSLNVRFSAEYYPPPTTPHPKVCDLGC
jgi:hypothetical protein